MGTWGMGIFDSDSAAEFLDKVIDELLVKVRNLFVEVLKKNFLLQSYGEQRIVPAIDIIITLSSHYETSPRVETDEAKAWKENYLKIFDIEMTNQYSEENFRERRQILLGTFDKLIKLAEEWD
jgi:hypothetical protein